LELTGDFLESRPDITGWRKLNSWIKEAKNKYHWVRRSSHRGGKHREQKLKNAAREYLKTANRISKKLHSLQRTPNTSILEKAQLERLKYFTGMVDKHIDLVKRRILKKEAIPHEEKVFSIFEPYTEWISKGKANRPVELGVKVCIATDTDGFILKHVVMQKQQDVDVIIPLTETLQEKYRIKSLSVDKGFWSKENYNTLQEKMPTVVMPKKGKCNHSEDQREHEQEFVRLRKRHSAVESNINTLEHHGAGRCFDRGIRGFRRYIALSVLAYNLHRLGNCLLEQDRLALKKAV